MLRLVRLNEDAGDGEFRDQLVRDLVDAYGGKLSDEDAERIAASVYSQANDVIARKERVEDVVGADADSEDPIVDWEDTLTSDRPAVTDDADFLSPQRVSRPYYPDLGDAGDEDEGDELGREADLLRRDAGLDPQGDLVDQADDVRDVEDDPDYDDPDAASDSDSDSDDADGSGDESDDGDEDVEVDMEIETDVEEPDGSESPEDGDDETKSEAKRKPGRPKGSKSSKKSGDEKESEDSEDEGDEDVEVDMEIETDVEDEGE